MSIIVNLENYTKQEGLGLIVKAVTTGKTASMVNIISGLRGSADVPFLSSEVALVSGHNCSLSDTGSSTFTPVRVDVGAVSYFETICTIAQLEDKALLYSVKMPDGLPFEAQFLADKADNISREIDRLIWNGEKPTDPVNGFLKMADDAGLYTEVTGGTATTVYGKVDELFDAAVAADSTFEYGNEVSVFMSYSNFRKYVKDLVAQNLFHYKAEDLLGGNGIQHPGTKLTIVPTEGLASNNGLFLADRNHLHIGTNLQSETEALQAIYESKSRTVYLRADMFLGTGVSKMIFGIEA